MEFKNEGTMETRFMRRVESLPDRANGDELIGIFCSCNCLSMEHYNCLRTQSYKFKGSDHYQSAPTRLTSTHNPKVG